MRVLWGILGIGHNIVALSRRSTSGVIHRSVLPYYPLDEFESRMHSFRSGDRGNSHNLGGLQDELAPMEGEMSVVEAGEPVNFEIVLLDLEVSTWYSRDSILCLVTQLSSRRLLRPILSHPQAPRVYDTVQFGNRGFGSIRSQISSSVVAFRRCKPGAIFTAFYVVVSILISKIVLLQELGSREIRGRSGSYASIYMSITSNNAHDLPESVRFFGSLCYSKPVYFS